jgi:hypothetical protein
MFGRMKAAALLAALLATTAPVAAADMDDTGTSGGYFGNWHVGASTYIDNIEDNDIWVPSLNVGGKLAYESGESNWGWQVDADLDYSNFNWVSPNISATGYIMNWDNAAHMTYRTSDTGKVGFYGALANTEIKVDGDRLNVTSLGLGVEGLTTISDTTWIQGRVGLYDPMYVSLTGAGSETDFFGDLIGATVGGSVHHAFTSNVSGRLMANYTYLGVSDAADVHAISLGAAVNYTFDSMPLSVGVNAGYTEAAVSDFSDGGLTVGSSLTYSFGGPSQGSTGKLFSSGITGFNL